jgi:hypothetical protein
VLWAIFCIWRVKELSRVLQEPFKIVLELLERTLTYFTQTPQARLEYNHQRMTNFQLPPTRKKPGLSNTYYEVDSYNLTDAIPHHDDTDITQKYRYKGPQFTITCYTNIDLAGQKETRQSTSGYLLFLNGALVYWHGRTERLIIESTSAGEYIALSRGHAASQFLSTILQFYGNKQAKYNLFTDNQSAEHIATQPNMNEHSRSIETRHHKVRQDYLDGKVEVMGVKTTENPSDIMTKFLPAPTHQQHSQHLHFNIPTHSHRENNIQQQQHNNHLPKNEWRTA